MPENKVPGAEAPNVDVLDAVRAELLARADPVRASGVQAYMKSSLPSLGVRVPEVRKLVLAAAVAHPFTSAGQLRSTVWNSGVRPQPGRSGTRRSISQGFEWWPVIP